MINIKKKKQFKAELIQNNKATILHRIKNIQTFSDYYQCIQKLMFVLNGHFMLHVTYIYMYIADVYCFF